MNKIRRRTAVINVGLVVIFAAILLAKLWLGKALVLNNDFYDYYVGSELFWAGKSPYGISKEFVETVDGLGLKFLWATGYSYPPLLAILFRPVIKIPVETAGFLWMAANLGLYGWWIWIVSKKSRGREAGMIIIYCLSYLPVIFSIGAGQVNIIILWLIYWYIYGREEKFKAGAWAAAAMIKVFPLYFLIPEMMRKNWRGIKYFLSWTAVLVLVTVLTGGGDDLHRYLTKVLPGLNQGYDAFFISQSLNGFVSRLLASADKKAAIISGTAQGQILAGLTVLALAGLCRWAGRIKNREERSLVWLGGMTLLAGRNSYWNFSPAVMLGIYLIKNLTRMGNKEKGWLAASVLISNLLWAGMYFLEATLAGGGNWGQRLFYAGITSLGAWGLLIQMILVGRAAERQAA